jgi:hypothetical protein
MDAAAIAPAAAAPRRRPRDWVVDSLLFLIALVLALLVVGGRLESPTPPDPGWLFTLDVIAGAVGCAGLWLRRRWPVGLALMLIALSTFSESVGGAMVVGLLTVAIHRSPRTTAAVFALSLAAALIYAVLRPDPGFPPLVVFLIGVVIQGAAVGWGLFIHFRRRLVESLRDRAARAETEAHSGPSRPSSAPATRSPGRCTTSSATGCRCSACTPAPSSSDPTLPPRRSPARPR